jgi:hypothetical protein
MASRLDNPSVYRSRGGATEAEIDYVRRLGQHCEGGHRTRPHAADVEVSRLKLLFNYRVTLDAPWRDWGHVDVERVRQVVQEEIDKEMADAPAAHSLQVYIPTNGHGLCGARRYATPVRKNRGRGSE